MSVRDSVDQDLPVSLSPEEMRRHLAAARNARDWRLLTLLYYSGGRVSEVLAACAGHLEERGIRLRTLKRRRPRDRFVVLPPAFVEELRAFAAGKPLDAPLVGQLRFPDVPLSREQAWAIFTRAALDAGILKQRRVGGPFRPAWVHTARHTHAVRLIEGGVPVPAVAEQLGHANLKNTAVYLQLADPRRAEMIERVAFD
jgi:integrase